MNKQETPGTSTVYLFNCRCTRLQWNPHPTSFVWANCKRCNGTGWVLYTDNDLWKYAGISIA